MLLFRLAQNVGISRTTWKCLILARIESNLATNFESFRLYLLSALNGLLSTTAVHTKGKSMT